MNRQPLCDSLTCIAVEFGLLLQLLFVALVLLLMECLVVVADDFNKVFK